MSASHTAAPPRRTANAIGNAVGCAELTAKLIPAMISIKNAHTDGIARTRYDGA